MASNERIADRLPKDASDILLHATGWNGVSNGGWRESFQTDLNSRDIDAAETLVTLMLFKRVGAASFMDPGNCCYRATELGQHVARHIAGGRGWIRADNSILKGESR